MVLAANSSQTPQCFGKLWDSKEPACMGGVDHTYTNSNGEHIRPTCKFQASCSIRTQATKSNNNSVIPASSLVRPPQPVAPAMPRPWQPPVSTYPYTQPTQPQQYGWQNSQQHQQQQTPYMMPVYSQIPQYLTVREPMNSSRTKRLFTEVMRSVGKSFGHTIANFFDMESFTDDPTKRQ